MSNEVVTVFAILTVFALVLIGVIIYAENNYSDKLEKLMNENTCDELYILKSGSKHISGIGEATYEKCMSDMFPNIDNKQFYGGHYYPSPIEIHQYFIDLECNDLGIHIIKRHFDYKKAHELYDVKCATPLHNLELGEIIFERSDTTVSKETWTKSDESNYGGQYRK